MTYNSSGKRVKPKRADFVYKKKRYWISDYDSVELWTGEYDCMTSFTIRDYESDNEIDYELLNEDDDFDEKAYNAGMRVFPTAGSSDMYGDRFY